MGMSRYILHIQLKGMIQTRRLQFLVCETKIILVKQLLDYRNILQTSLIFILKPSISSFSMTNSLKLLIYEHIWHLFLVLLQ